MPFRDDMIFQGQTLTFDYIFKDENEFVDKVGNIGTVNDADDLKELYEILALKYVTAQTRYDREFPFIMAIKRELQNVFPHYIERKALDLQIQGISIDEIMKQGKQLRNRIDTHDNDVVDADKYPIPNLSNEQESILMQGNELDALKAKFNALKSNFTQDLYKACDKLFKVVLAEDINYLFRR